MRQGEQGGDGVDAGEEDGGVGDGSGADASAGQEDERDGDAKPGTGSACGGKQDAARVAAGATAGKEDAAEDGRDGVEQCRDAGADEGLPGVGTDERQQDERSEQDAEAGDAGKAGNDAADVDLEAINNQFGGMETLQATSLHVPFCRSAVVLSEQPPSGVVTGLAKTERAHKFCVVPLGGFYPPYVAARHFPCQ